MRIIGIYYIIFISFKRFECIDTLNIPDIVIYNCRKIYETWGKLKVYDELDQRMYDYDHGLDIKCERTLRYLNLYRQAYIQTKCAYMDSDVSDTDIKDVNTIFESYAFDTVLHKL